MSIYQDLLLDHYRNPHHRGRLEACTHTATSENLTCGDTITVDLQLTEGCVSTAMFEGVGCVISQASASLLMDYMIGKTADQVRVMTKDDILELLGIELSPNRLKCALLSLEVAQKALRQAV